jgi:hypothetical protein
MNRFSKILTVLLTVSLLVGIVATLSVSADDTVQYETPRLIYANGAGTFSEDTVSIRVGGQSNKNFGKGLVRERKRSSDGRDYLSIRSDINAAAPDVDAQAHLLAGITLPIYDGKDGVTDRDDFAINTENPVTVMTYDFDLGFDQYKYVYIDSDGLQAETLDVNNVFGMTEVSSLKDIAADKYFKMPAVPDNFKIYFEAYCNGGEKNHGVSYNFLTDEDGTIYVSNKASLTGEGAVNIRLSNKVNVYDHFTLIYRISDSNPESTTNGNKIELFLFVNGQFLADASNTAHESVTQFSIKRLYYAFTKATGSVSDSTFKRVDNFSIAFDNVAANYYTASDYVEGGIYDYIWSEDFQSRSLMDCKDVVYNGDYIKPGAPKIAIVTTPEGSVDCFTRNSLYQSLSDGAFVETSMSILNYTPDESIKEITFISVDGATVSLSPEASEIYKMQHTGDRYNVVLANDSTMSINWYDAAGANGKVIKTTKLVPMVTTRSSLKIYGAVDRSNESSPTIEIFQKWMWDVDGDGVGDEEANKILGRKFTVAQINTELREKGINEINMVPVYKTCALAYALEKYNPETESFEFYAPDKNYAKFVDINSIETALSKIAEDEEVYLTVYADVEVYEGLSIPEGVTLNFDLNGHAVTLFDATSLFILSDNATLNLYSKKAGAKVEGSTVLASNDAEFCKVNIGKFLDSEGNTVAEGDNVTVSAASLLSDSFSAAEIDLDGGNYIGTSSKGALFRVSAAGTKLNISDAYVLTTAGASAIAVASSATAAEISIADSDVYVGTLNGTDYTVGSFVDTWFATSKLYVENSVVLGYKNNSGMSLGAGNAFNAVCDDKLVDLSLAGGVKAAFANSGAAKKAVSVNVPGQTSVALEVEITLLTVKELSESGYSIKEVKWLTPAGDVSSTSYWVAGSVVNYFASTKDFETVVTGNGWFNVGYGGWVNAAGASDFTVPQNAECSFKPAEKYLPVFNSAKVNLTVCDGLAYNLYVPTPSVNGYTMSFVGFFDADGNALTTVKNNVTLDGVAGWAKLVGMFANNEFESDTVVVKYTVNGQTVSANVAVDMFNYVYKASEAYPCGTAESKLIYAALTYKYEVFMKSDASNDEKAAAERNVKMYLDSVHGADCECADVDYVAPDITANDASIKSLVTSYSYSLSVDSENGASSKYAFSIVVPKSAGVSAATINGYNAEVIDLGDSYEFTVSGLVLGELCDNISISLTKSGSAVSGSYSLAKYIEETDSSFAKALYVLSMEAGN